VEESTVSGFSTVFPQGTNRNNIWFKSDLIFPQALLASTVATCMSGGTMGIMHTKAVESMAHKILL